MTEHVPVDAPSLTDSLHSPDDEYERRFGGVARLYGEQNFQRFARAHVMVAGLGGVGSWVAEGLARSAIGRLTLVDMDAVAPSNINRQLPALSGTFGHDKTAVMQERLLQINPRLQVTVVDDFLTPDNLPELITQALANTDDDLPLVIVDATDDMKAKLALAEYVLQPYQNRVKLLTCGGAGGKTDPTAIRIADLWQTSHDPLLARLRSQVRKSLPRLAGRKKSGLDCIYSLEPMRNQQSCQSAGLNCGGYGSAVSMTASFGFFAVADILKKLAQKPA